MKKLKKICVVILFFAIFQLNLVDAKQVNTNKLNHVNVYIDGQVYIDTQINGVSQDYKNVVVDIYDVSIEIDENNEKKKYTSLEEQINQDNGEKNFYKDVDFFSENAVITINGMIKSEDLNINMTFNKMYSKEKLLEAIQECPNQNGCDIRITSEEVKNIITYDVIFKTEDGGKFFDDQEYIEHINIVPGETFPNEPELIPNENYNFLGWYNEDTGLKIEEFPLIVTEDCIIIAKWELDEKTNEYNNKIDTNYDGQGIDSELLKSSNINKEEKVNENFKTIETTTKAINEDNNIIVLDNSNLGSLYSYNPPKTAVENNIVLLIVSFIICMTATIKVGHKFKGQ